MRLERGRGRSRIEQSLFCPVVPTVAPPSWPPPLALVRIRHPPRPAPGRPRLFSGPSLLLSLGPCVKVLQDWGGGGQTKGGSRMWGPLPKSSRFSRTRLQSSAEGNNTGMSQSDARLQARLCHMLNERPLLAFLASVFSSVQRVPTSHRCVMNT